MPRVIRFASKPVPDAVAAAMEGTALGDDAYDEVVGGEAVDCYTEAGEPLFLLRTGVIDPGVCRRAFPVLWTAASVSYNRGAAAGGGGRRAVRRDGTLSNTRTSDPVLSGNVGFYPRTRRAPYCRPTAWTWRHAGRWPPALDFFRAIHDVFAGEPAVAHRYEAQRVAAAGTPGEWVMPGTVFSTAAVNLNFPTRVHKDRGDLPEGFGAMSVLRAGAYQGGHLVFPQYRIAVDLRTQDVLLSDVHQWHGNAPLHGAEGEYARLSVVCYFLTRMRQCLPPADEWERLKRRRPGDPLV